MSLPPVREPDLRAKPKHDTGVPSKTPDITERLAGVMGAPATIEMDAGAVLPAPEPDVHEGVVEGPDADAIAAYDAAVAKKTDAVWYVVVGVVMLFLSSFHWGVGAGGVLMVVYGGFRYAQFSRVARHAYDPWQDDDIDAWEKTEMSAKE